jgi:probable rRNA maturation factor
MPSIAPVTADILVTAAGWQAEPETEALVQRAIEAAAKHASASARACEVAIVLTDDSGIKTLNRDWRGIDKPTNVLSFPAAATPGREAEPRMLGDIAIAYETTAREARDEGKPFGHHLSHLVVHGFLHLVGYDHEDDAEAETMESLERTILKSLSVPDPYA